MGRKKEKKQSGAPAWMTTFSDLMTLLLTFFILLYSFSTLDAIKFKNVASALQSVLLGQANVTIFANDIPPADSAIAPPIPIPGDEKKRKESLIKLYNEVVTFIENQGIESDVNIIVEEGGVLININEKVLFDLGEADLKKDSKIILDKISILFETIENDIIIEGHTDNLPIKTSSYPSNWELSAARSVHVVRYFVEKCRVDPTRISATGYGEYKPLVDNDTIENRALNRRVNIMLLVTGEVE